VKKNKSALGVVKKTARNFPIIYFKDCYSTECSLQMSSVILEAQEQDTLNNPGTSAVWLGCEDNAFHEASGQPVSPRMHLDREQVAALIHVLQKWLRTGKFA